MSKSFTITITGDCPDDLSDALILRAASEATVPIIRSQQWIEGLEFLVTNVRTDVKIETEVTQAENEIDAALRETMQLYGGVVGTTNNSKIDAIKHLRSKCVGLGLKEAKDLIDAQWP